MKKYGFKQHRLIRDDPYYKYECSLSDRLLKEPYIDWDLLVFGPDENNYWPKDTLSEREKHIFASTIQWLGTPVGRSFLEYSGFITEEACEKRRNRQKSDLKKMSIWQFLKWRREI